MIEKLLKIYPFRLSINCYQVPSQSSSMDQNQLHNQQILSNFFTMYNPDFSVTSPSIAQPNNQIQQYLNPLQAMCQASQQISPPQPQFSSPVFFPQQNPILRPQPQFPVAVPAFRPSLPGGSSEFCEPAERIPFYDPEDQINADDPSSLENAEIDDTEFDGNEINHDSTFD